jgi:hypothetical protein
MRTTKHLISLIVAGALLAACGEPPTEPTKPQPGERITGRKIAEQAVQATVSQAAVHLCFPGLLCPDRPPMPVTLGSCSGMLNAYSDVAFTGVTLWSEYPPDSPAGWCVFSTPEFDGMGLNLPGFPNTFNDNLSTVSIGPDAHIDLFEHSSGGGASVGLNGSPALRPNVVDLHQLQVCTPQGCGPVGWWADRVSSVRTCLRADVVNGRCP